MKPRITGHQLRERLAEIDDRLGQDRRGNVRRWLARRLCVTESVISLYVSGLRVPKPERIDEIAKLLGLHVPKPERIDEIARLLGLKGGAK